MSSPSEHNDDEEAYEVNHPRAARSQRHNYHDDPNFESDALGTASNESSDELRSKQHFLPRQQHPNHTIRNTTIRDDGDETFCVRIGTETEDGNPLNDDVVVNMNLLQMIQTPTAIAMLWTTVILTGAGTVETNNMGQMVESLRFDPSITSASLAFFSVAQAASQVFTVTISESAFTWNAFGQHVIPYAM